MEHAGGSVLTTQHIIGKKLHIVGRTFVDEGTKLRANQQKKMGAEAQYYQENGEQPSTATYFSTEMIIE